MSSKDHKPERPETIEKYRAVQERFKELYQVQRIRNDDVINILKKEFFIASEFTIWRILRTDLPPVANQVEAE